MKRNYFLLPLLFLTWGCDYEEKLNPIPSTLVSEVTAFENADRIANQVNGLYATFKKTGFWGSQYIYYTESRAGNFVSTNLNPTRGGLSYQMAVDASSSDVDNVWTQGYQVINACNLFIERAAINAQELLGEQTYNSYLAEARFLRAITYYYLLQLYAQPYLKDQGAGPGLPLRLDANTGLKDYTLARSSVKDVYSFIRAELDFAEQNLPDNYNLALTNTTRAHKNTAIGMKTNILLAQGDYLAVIQEANKLVPNQAPYKSNSGVANQLVEDVTSIFSPPFTSMESMLSMPFSTSDLPGAALGNSFLPDGANATGYGVSGTGDYYLLPSGVVSNTDWKDTDARRQFIFTTTTGALRGRQWCTKYNLGTPFADFIPVLRYSQVMLNLAEALAQQNGLDAHAVQLLNAVRQRSDNTTTFSPTSTSELLDLILIERDIEFLGEGVRNIDLVRQLKPIPAKRPSGGSSVPEVKPTEINYIWPLPTSETLYNEAL